MGASRRILNHFYPKVEACWRDLPPPADRGRQTQAAHSGNYSPASFAAAARLSHFDEVQAKRKKDDSSSSNRLTAFSATAWRQFFTALPWQRTELLCVTLMRSNDNGNFAHKKTSTGKKPTGACQTGSFNLIQLYFLAAIYLYIYLLTSGL